MLFIPIIAGFLLIVSFVQTLFLQKVQNKIQSPPYNYGAENPYFPRPLPYNFPHSTVSPQKAPSDEDILQLKKKQEEQSILYTFLFVLGLLAYLIYN
jgi:hypothetical protein